MESEEAGVSTTSHRSCCFCEDSREESIFPFTKKSFYTVQHSILEWINLYGVERDIAVRLREIFTNANDYELSQLVFHRKCYSRFCDSRAIKRALSNLAKKGSTEEVAAGISGELLVQEDDKRQRRGRKPREVVPEEEDRGSGKRKRNRKAPSWMLHDDFLVGRKTVDATRSEIEAEDDGPVVSKASLLHADKMGEDEEEAEELAAAGEKDVLGFKNWVSSQSSNDAVLDENSLGNRIVDKDQSPPRHLKEKIIKPFACGVCQRHPLTEKRKSYLDEDTQTVQCDKCQGWFSARGIKRHKAIAHGGRLCEGGEVSGSGAENVEVSGSTPQSGRVTGATGQCRLCNFHAVTSHQLAKHLKYTHKVEANSHKRAPSDKGEEVVAAGGAGVGASSYPVIDIRPDGNKIYIDAHLNLQPDDAARICAQVMTIPDNAEIIILK